jgi:hypothetical protein
MGDQLRVRMHHCELPQAQAVGGKRQLILNKAAFLKRQRPSETTCAEQHEAATPKRKKSAPAILPGVRGTQMEKRPKGHGGTREDAICLSD